MGISIADLTGVGTVVSGIKDVLGMFFPDKTEEEKTRMAQAFALMQGQLDINKAEAANPNVFTSGWRPAVGWIGAISLGMIYIPKALVLTGIWTYQAIVVISAWNGAGQVTLPLYPDLGVSDLIGLLGSMLGFGILRSVDKRNGVAS